MSIGALPGRSALEQQEQSPALPKAKDATRQSPASPILSEDPQLLILWIAQILENSSAPSLLSISLLPLPMPLGFTATDSTELKLSLVQTQHWCVSPIQTPTGSLGPPLT